MAFALEPEQSLELIGPTWPKAGLQPGSRGAEDADPAQNEHVLAVLKPSSPLMAPASRLSRIEEHYK